MKTIARLALPALFVITVFTASSPANATDIFEQVSSVTTVETVTVSGSAGVNF